MNGIDFLRGTRAAGNNVPFGFVTSEGVLHGAAKAPFIFFTLDELMDPARTAAVPHPFFVADAAKRADVVKFLKSLDDDPLK